MLSRVIALGLLVCTLSACATKDAGQDPKTVVGKKCESAKQNLEKAVKEGELDDVHEMKRNIELYCVWRNN